jgi:hypothetical protein
MKIPILSGRDYDEHDEVGPVGSLPSVIVNRSLAERFWPGQDAVGAVSGAMLAVARLACRIESAALRAE